MNEAVNNDSRNPRPGSAAKASEVTTKIPCNPTKFYYSQVADLKSSYPFDFKFQVMNIFDATTKGNLILIKELLKNGEKIGVTHSNGQTLLHLAAQNGWIECCKFFIESGLDVNTKDSSGLTPILAAEKAGYDDIKTYLENIGEMVNSNITFGNKCTAPYNPESLCGAAYSGNFESLKSLVSRNDIDKTETWGDKKYSALHCAIIKSKEMDQTTVIGKGKCFIELIDNDFDVNFKALDGYTPLHAAAEIGNLEMIKHLVAKGADIKAKGGYYQCSALHYATFTNSIGCCEYLIKAGIDVNIENDFGFTPLHAASHFGKKVIIEFLIDNGANPLAKTKCNKNALYYASNRDKKKKKCLRYLVPLTKSRN